MPWLAGLLLAPLPRQYRKDPEKAFRKQFGHGLSEEDARILARPEIRANLLAGAVEAMCQGTQGPAAELQLLFARPWGFRVEDIAREVQLWYGDADALVPLQAGRYLSSTLKRGKLTICSGEGHLLYVPRWAEIVRTLTIL
jgi:pimeloyl-ACP methyl ester carboxylesterase